MSCIAINDLRPVGADLFMDSESFMNDLSEEELNSTEGGLFALATIVSTVACAGVAVSVTITIGVGVIINEYA